MIVFGGVVSFLLMFPLAASIATSFALSYGFTLLWNPPAAIVMGVIWQLGLIVQFLVIFILYVIAAIATPPVQGPVPANGAEHFCRGALIGINAAANFCYLLVAIPAILPVLGWALSPATLVVAVIVGVVNWLCVFDGLTRNFAFATVLAWCGWFMPMNWLYQLLGLVLFILLAISSAFGMGFASLGAWWPGSIARHGFWFGFSGAFTLGNFTFVSPSLGRTSPRFVGASAGIDTALGVVSHEVGHTMTTAAFGNMFSLIAFVHDRLWTWFGLIGGRTYGEMLTEGVRRKSGNPNQPPVDESPWIDMWAPPVALSGAGGGNAIPTVTALADGVDFTDGINVPGAVGVAVTLDASGSSDPDAFPMGNVSPGGTPTLGFAWQLSGTPNGSTAAIAAPNAATTSFTPDVVGDYVVDVVVSDGAEGESFSITVVV